MQRVHKENTRGSRDIVYASKYAITFMKDMFPGYLINISVIS
jgi:hypothetical protein